MFFFLSSFFLGKMDVYICTKTFGVLSTPIFNFNKEPADMCVCLSFGFLNSAHYTTGLAYRGCIPRRQLPMFCFTTNPETGGGGYSSVT